MDIGISLTILCAISSLLVLANAAFAVHKGEIGHAYPISLFRSPIRKTDSPKMFAAALIIMFVLGVVGILLAAYFATYIPV